MKTRCYNKNDKHYKHYGARGIIISDEWLVFENFKDWSLNNGYDNNLTIDRIDVNGNYCPDNCRWVDIFVQNNNKILPLQNQALPALLYAIAFHTYRYQ